LKMCLVPGSTYDDPS